MFKDEPADVAKRKRATLLQVASMWGAYIGSPVYRQSLKYFWLEECIEVSIVSGTLRLGGLTDNILFARAKIRSSQRHITRSLRLFPRLREPRQISDSTHKWLAFTHTMVVTRTWARPAGDQV